MLARPLCPFAALASSLVIAFAPLAHAAWTPPPACASPDPACGNPSSWVLAGYIWGEEVGVCGVSAYDALLTCAAGQCSGASFCGTAPTGDTVLDILTQWINCDPDNCTPDGIPDACGSCMDRQCARQLATYAAAGCM